MGTHSDSEICPKCSKEMNTSLDTRSGYVSGECLNCGFNYFVTEERYDLDTLNEIREAVDLKPLKKLPKWVQE